MGLAISGSAMAAGVEGLADICADSACSIACMAAGNGLSNPSSSSSTLDVPDGLKGKPPVTSPKLSLGGLGAAGAAMAPMARRAIEMYEACIMMIGLKPVLARNKREYMRSEAKKMKDWLAFGLKGYQSFYV